MVRDLEDAVVPAGRDDRLDAVWRLKERIRREDGALKQPRDHFERAYRRSRVSLLLDGDAVVAFGVVQGGDYLSLFGVSPDHRRRGLGTRLLESILADAGTLACHTRADNRAAVGFYADRGFAVVRHIDSYYPDGTDGLLLEHG